MSKRSERREAEREARKLAYQQLRQQPPATASLPAPVEAPANQSHLLERAQAFFDRPAAPTSPAQIEANRANAQHSTGPVSSAGKAISSRNNTRHGLAGECEGDNFQVLGNESQTDYDKDLHNFRAEWKPGTATEHDLVNRMVTHRWLRLRALRLQQTLFDAHTGEITDLRKFELYRRYEGSHERGFNKALADMQRLRSFQLRERNGFESQRRKNEEHELKMRRLRAKEEQQNAKNAPSKTSTGVPLGTEFQPPQAAHS